MAEGVSTMAESTPTELSLISPAQVAEQTPARQSPNGIRFASFAENGVAPQDLERMVQAVPTSIAAALTRKTYYFVPLAISEGRPTQPAAPPVGHRTSHDDTMIAQAYTSELAELAICHRNVDLPTAHGNAQIGNNQINEGVFISTRLLSDRFSLAFEFFINVGHAFVDTAGVPEAFSTLAWNQALADTRGETSQDAWEFRALALTGGENPPPHNENGKPPIDEKSKNEFLEAAFADAVAIYLLSLAVDFDYSELREREYPLLAPQALAERLRLIAKLFPPNPTYEFSIRYRRRA